MERCLFLPLLCMATVAANAQTTSFTYQGRLAASGLPYTGLAEMQFALFAVTNGGTPIAASTPPTNVTVSAGLFTVPLDFGPGAFPGADRFLEIQVRTNTGSFFTLTPRQKVTPAPFAITAEDVANANVVRLNVPNTSVPATGHPNVTSGFITAATLDIPGSGYTTPPAVTVNANGPGSGAVIVATVSGGAISALTVTDAGSGYTSSATLAIGAPPANNYQLFVTSNFFPNVNVFSNPANVFVGDGAGLSNVWKSGGNAGANPANGNFLGTTDNQALEFKVYGVRALRLEPTTNGPPNLVGGSASNSVAPGVAGAVIAGGLGHTIQRGANNSTIGGGDSNTIQTNAFNSTIGGGENNSISPFVQWATIPGGQENSVTGDLGIAAGYRATAGQGCFVWSDYIVAGDVDFGSTEANQFAVRAHGGVLLAADVKIGKNSSDYHRLELGGGNSSGFLYGSYPRFGDGIHLGYNYYASAHGSNIVIAPDGATSRLTVGYGEIILAVGDVGLPPTAEKLVVNTSSVTVNGTFNNNSDRNAKQDFQPVSASQILEKVARLPLNEWSYKDDAATRHLGPIAQDFHSTFHLGTDDKHIAPIDEGGVALAAIQGLNQKLTDELKRRDAENAELKQRLERLEQLLNQLNGGAR